MPIITITTEDGRPVRRIDLASFIGDAAIEPSDDAYFGAVENTLWEAVAKATAIEDAGAAGRRAAEVALANHEALMAESAAEDYVDSGDLLNVAADLAAALRAALGLP